LVNDFADACERICGSYGERFRHSAMAPLQMREGVCGLGSQLGLRATSLFVR
jgi:hypothetical protein